MYALAIVFRDTVNYILGVVMLFFWLVGVVLANGFWSTVSSIFFFPYAWYLVMEKMVSMGMLNLLVGQ